MNFHQKLSAIALLCLSIVSLSVGAIQVPANHENPEENRLVSQSVVRFTSVSYAGNNSVKRSTCTASWISRRSHLTAAHCKKTFTSNGILVMTTFSEGLIASEIELNPDQYTFHPHESYRQNSKRPEFDVAVLTLAPDVEIPEHTIATFAPTDLVNLDGNIFFTAAGGLEIRTILNELPQEQKSAIETQIEKPLDALTVEELTQLGIHFSENRGLQTFVSTQTEPYLDAFSALKVDAPPSVKICKGDSGGPLFKKANSGAMVQIGVHSLALIEPDTASCGPTAFDTFLDAMKIVWISETMTAQEGLSEFTGIQVYGAHWISFPMGDLMIEGLKLGDKEVQ